MEALTLAPGWTDSLPRLTRVARNGPVLHETGLAPAADVLGLNLTRGCGHRCAFCSVRASPNYPADEVVLFTNTVELLCDELTRAQPRAVYLCPGADPFPPYALVQEAAADVVEALAAHGVESWLMTRGEVMPSVLERLRPFAATTRFTVALPTLHPATAALLEADAAPPEVRLELIGRLKEMGFAVQMALDPLVPQVSDTPEALNPLLDALAGRGVTALTASYLFLRQNIAEQMRAALPGDVCSAVLTAYEGGPVLTSAGLAGARYLPRSRRQRGYATLMALASRRGMSVTVSSLTNPDFTPTRPATQPATSLLAAYRKAVARATA
ncbi:MAG: radical SAM protein [Gemmataceae bacterium]